MLFIELRGIDGCIPYVVVKFFFWFKNFQTSLIFISLCLGLW